MLAPRTAARRAVASVADMASCGRAVVLSIVLWAVGGALLAYHFVHDRHDQQLTPHTHYHHPMGRSEERWSFFRLPDATITNNNNNNNNNEKAVGGSAFSSSASVDNASSPASQLLLRHHHHDHQVVPKPANYCEAHGPHTQRWGGPDFLARQAELPLIAIAVATTSRHMEDRNGPDAAKVKTSELKRRGQFLSSSSSSSSFSSGRSYHHHHARRPLQVATELRHIPPRLRRSSQIIAAVNNGSLRWEAKKYRRDKSVAPSYNASAAARMATESARWYSPESFSLFRVLLPSVVRTLECGFRYAVVVGFDVGDPFYDNSTSRRGVREWFRARVASPARLRGIEVALAFARVNNTLRKPGPAFTAMTRAAFDAPATKASSPTTGTTATAGGGSPSSSSSSQSHHHNHQSHRHPDHDHDHQRSGLGGGLGATFCYRVNDDSEFLGPWASRLSSALLRLGPPFGVVGPLVCNRGGNHRILTHDFVHREHMDIFDRWYYPPELADWWMDAWISRVYGRARTVLVDSVLVRHRTKEHGRRYAVDFKNKEKLEALVEVGRAQIASHMRRAGTVSLKTIEKFLGDHFDGNSADASRGRSSGALLGSCNVP